MRRTPRLLISAVALFGFIGTSCSSNSSDSAATTPISVAVTAAPTTTSAPSTIPSVAGDVVVFAGSSLTEAFGEMATAFTSAHPDAKLKFNFAGSGDLVTQISQGAPVDVFVSADDSNMKKLVEADEAAGEPISIAKNTFQVIVEKGNPKGITGVADLSKPDLLVVLCADTVPCGKGAATILKNAGVTVTPKSLEDKVKGVVTKVTAGEADAGIVYVTDVKAAGDNASGVDIPAAVNVVNNYPIVLTKEATNTKGAQAFIDFVSSAAGQAILAKYGFLAP